MSFRERMDDANRRGAGRRAGNDAVRREDERQRSRREAGRRQRAWMDEAAREDKRSGINKYSDLDERFRPIMATAGHALFGRAFRDVNTLYDYYSRKSGQSGPFIYTGVSWQIRTTFNDGFAFYKVELKEVLFLKSLRIRHKDGQFSVSCTEEGLQNGLIRIAQEGLRPCEVQHVAQPPFHEGG